jgi:hypothetical protein
LAFNCPNKFICRQIVRVYETIGSTRINQAIMSCDTPSCSCNNYLENLKYQLTSKKDFEVWPLKKLGKTFIATAKIETKLNFIGLKTSARRRRQVLRAVCKFFVQPAYHVFIFSYRIINNLFLEMTKNKKSKYFLN